MQLMYLKYIYMWFKRVLWVSKISWQINARVVQEILENMMMKKKMVTIEVKLVIFLRDDDGDIIMNFEDAIKPN